MTGPEREATMTARGPGAARPATGDGDIRPPAPAAPTGAAFPGLRDRAALPEAARLADAMPAAGRRAALRAPVPLDAGGLPAGRCPACGKGGFWKDASLPPEGPGWRCGACDPAPADLWRHGCAVPPGWRP